MAVPIVLLGIFATGRPAEALPRNTHQVPEGYWVGAAPEVGDIEALHARGVRLVLSGVRLDQAVLDECERIGVRQVNVRLGSTFRIGPRVLSAIGGYAPEEIFIHCEHGGDRAGAILAFILVVREGWAPDHAMLAVAFPGVNDLRRMIALLESRGMIITAQDREQYAGIYSGASCGGTGGLKVRGDRYANLVTTTLDAFEEQGVQLFEVPPDPPVSTDSASGTPEEIPETSP